MFVYARSSPTTKREISLAGSQHKTQCNASQQSRPKLRNSFTGDSIKYRKRHPSGLSRAHQARHRHRSRGRGGKNRIEANRKRVRMLKKVVRGKVSEKHLGTEMQPHARAGCRLCSGTVEGA